MERIEQIRNHPVFAANYRLLEEAEADRRFCCHQLPHLLDVARIAYIRNLEQELGFSKEIIYAAAILHDIGKYRQYADRTPHEEAGAKIAGKILADVDGFSAKEKAEILQAIWEHRRKTEMMSPLGRLLYDSDKLSRACYACAAREACSWSAEKMNQGIRV